MMLRIIITMMMWSRRNIFPQPNAENDEYVFLGKGGASKTDEFLEKFQTAFDPPPLIFGKSCYAFFPEYMT